MEFVVAALVGILLADDILRLVNRKRSGMGRSRC
jgi:hypothetical protein